MSRLELLIASRGVFADDEPRPAPIRHGGNHIRKRPAIALPAHRTQEQVAKLLGMDRRNVQMIEQRALEKLRREIERRASLAGVSVQEWMDV